MPITLDLSTILTVLVAALALILVAWFFLGMQWNLTRGNAALRWLKPGMPVITEKTTLRWLGSSVVQMGMNNPHAPFKHIDLLVMLEPRDVALLWLAARLRGRRDALILRGDLRRQSLYAFDVLAPASWSGKDALAHHTPADWAQTPHEGLVIAAEDAESAAMARRVLQVIAGGGTGVLRISARRTVPHLQVHLAAPWTGTASADDVLRACKEAGNMLLTDVSRQQSDIRAR